MTDEVLIQVDHAAKKFCRSLKRALWYGVRDIGTELVGGNGHHGTLRPGEFWAVDDVSFSVRRGECLGLIGPNGAGKSTLLKMLNGLIKPDRGSIAMRGRVGALIELGTGFNPILTGRENIYNNAAVLGLSKREVDGKLEAIVDFADLPDDAIDAPVQSYSSGMKVRLGFAVAAHIDPDVLLIDEVLAVGDAGFRNKCYHRIGELRRDAAVVFVSHAMPHVCRICDRVGVLAGGRTQHLGDVDAGINVYERACAVNKDTEPQFLSCYHPILGFSAEVPAEVEFGKPLRIALRLSAQAAVDSFVLKILFYNPSGDIAAECVLRDGDYGIKIEPGRLAWTIDIPALPLRENVYRVAFNLLDARGEVIVWSYKCHQVGLRGGAVGSLADCQLDALWSQDIVNAAGSRTH